MSDTTLNQFVGSGTAADMAGFTPSPPSPANAPPNPGYVFFNTDDSILYSWDGANWVAPAGTGTVTNTGTLTANQLIVGNGGVDIKVSDLTGDVTTSGGVATTLKTAAKTRQLTFGFDGGGSVLTTGVQKNNLQVQYACTITAWSVLLDQSGSIVFDIWKDTEANYPPTVADTITAAAKPTVTTATHNSGSPTAWTTSVAAGDTFRINIDSVTTATSATLILTVTV